MSQTEYKIKPGNIKSTSEETSYKIEHANNK